MARRILQRAQVRPTNLETRKPGSKTPASKKKQAARAKRKAVR